MKKLLLCAAPAAPAARALCARTAPERPPLESPDVLLDEAQAASRRLRPFLAGAGVRLRESSSAQALDDSMPRGAPGPAARAERSRSIRARVDGDSRTFKASTEEAGAPVPR